MPPAFFNMTVNVYRRTSQGVDTLNNPIYGTPTSGIGWTLIYSAMPAKLAFSTKQIQFKATGENPEPTGVVYCGSAYTILPEDRVLTSDASPIEYVVTSVVAALNTATNVDHYECIIKLPV